MLMKNAVAIVLAAGRGTRMKSDVPKVMHGILGLPMLSHVLGALEGASVRKRIVIAGYGAALLKDAFKKEKVLVQKRLLGSGDAVNTARSALKGYYGDVIVICGDTPFIRPDSIKNVMAEHAAQGASATVLSIVIDDPADYGRVVREGGRVIKIVEAKDASPAELRIKEINSGTYCFRSKDLFSALGKVKPGNSKKEYYLTDVIDILNGMGKKVIGVTSSDAAEAIGVNSRQDMARANKVIKERVLDKLMSEGVTIEDPETTTIYPGAKIGRDTIIHPNTIIESDVAIGARSSIGPFARIRPMVKLGDDVEVGNFVELVRTIVGNRTKIKHHTYLGDTVVGKDVNIGAGTITANFDGKNKSKTFIGDGASIGVGVRFIAPVKIGARAVVGAGCVVTKNHNVPSGATVVGVPAKILQR